MGLCKQPLILGYLLGGVLVGPNLGLELVRSHESVAEIANLGLVFLLFMCLGGAFLSACMRFGGRRCSEGPEGLGPKEFSCFGGDFVEQDRVKRVLKAADHLIHLAVVRANDSVFSHPAFTRAEVSRKFRRGGSCHILEVNTNCKHLAK